MGNYHTAQASDCMALQGVSCKPSIELSIPALIEIEKRFVDLFDALRKPLVRYLLWMRVRPDIAEGVVQETFSRLYEHLTRRKLSDDNLAGWIWKVAHNLALKQLQAFKRDNLPMDFKLDVAFNALEDPTPNPEERVQLDQRQKRLLGELDELSVRERQCLHLRAEGLGYREIGQVLGVGRSTVADTMRRAMDRMRKVVHD